MKQIREKYLENMVAVVNQTGMEITNAQWRALKSCFCVLGESNRFAVEKSYDIDSILAEHFPHVMLVY